MSMNRIVRFMVAALWAAPSAAVHAEGTSGSLVLHLDQVQYDVVFGDGGPGGIASGSLGFVVAGAAASVNGIQPGDSVVALDPFAEVSAQASVSSASASSTAGSVLEVGFSLIPYPHGEGHRAVSQADKSLYLWFTGAGTLVVQVPYTLQMEFNEIDPGYAHVSGEIWAQRPDYEAATAYSSGVSATLFNGVQPDNESGFPSVSKSGLLSIAVPFLSGEWIRFSAFAYSDAHYLPDPTVVPLPPALWLLGGALALLGAQRRRAA